MLEDADSHSAVIRACIAMAYPVHRFNRRRARVESGHEGSLSEVVPANKTKRTWMRSMVHFAIDPSNSMLPTASYSDFY